MKATRSPLVSIALFSVLGHLSASPALAAPSLALSSASGGAGTSVTLALTLTNDSQAVGFQCDLVYDPAQLAGGVPVLGAALASTDAVIDYYTPAANTLRLVVMSLSTSVLPSGEAVRVPTWLQPGAATGNAPVTLANVEFADDLAAQLPNGTLTGGSVGIAARPCLLGDISPDGVGDGFVTLADFVLGRRKLIGITPLNARDGQCGDAHPGSVTCAPGGQQSWCPAGNGFFQLADAVVIRRLVLGAQVASCTACALGSPQVLTDWSPGDVAPRGAPDGRVDVGDVVALLRVAAGLDVLGEEDLLRADVAPCDVADGLRLARGNARVDVGDVVTVLRASVGLDVLAWPERALAVRLEGERAFVAWQAVVSGWPRWARVTATIAEGCAPDEVERWGDRLGAACITEPQALAPPVDVLTVRYAGPREIATANVSVDVAAVDAALALVPVRGSLAAR